MSAHHNLSPAPAQGRRIPAARRRNTRTPTPPRRTRTGWLTPLACVLALILSSASPALAGGGEGAVSVVVDVLIARPISAAATVAGAALFVVALPFAAPSRSLDATSQTLVVAPARDLFTRPVGDLDDFLCY